MARRAATPAVRDRAVTSAGTPISVDDAEYRKAVARRRQAWQDEAWFNFDEIGEVHYAVTFVGQALARVRLFAAVRPTADAEPVDVLDEDSGIPEGDAREIADVLADLRSERGGQAEIVRRTSMNLDVPGECYVVEAAARNLEDEAGGPVLVWEVRSVPGEIRSRGDRWEVTDQAGKWQPLDSSRRLFRVHSPHPADALRADSPMRGVLNECETLLILSRQMRAEAKSRLPAGILKVPTELGYEPPDPQNPDPMTNPLVRSLVESLTAPIRDEAAASAVVPHLVFGPAAVLDSLALLNMARSDAAVLEARIQQRIQRIAHGLNLPVEVVVGHQQTTFANAAMIDKSKFEDHIEPRAVAMVDAFTDGYLQPALAERGLDYSDVFVWFDPSALIVNPERSEDAFKAHEALVISDTALRRTLQFGEDDAPDDDERLRRWVLNAASQVDAATAAAVLEDATVDLPEPIEPEEPAAPIAPPAAVPNLPPEPVAAAARPRRPLGRRLALIDRGLLDRLTTAADAAMTQALRRAGSRLKAQAANTTLAASVKGVRADRVCAAVGRDALAAAGIAEDGLLDGAFDDLRPKWDAWVRAAQANSVDAVRSRLDSDDDPPDWQAARLQQDEDRDEGWLLLLGLLTGVARSRLFKAADVEAGVVLGEVPAAVNVPPGTIRVALQRAGGAQGPIRGSSIFVGDRPAGLVATGELLQDLARQALGVVWQGWVWVYGDPAARQTPFEPHEALDGTEFGSYGDASLTVAEDSFISSHTGGYFPGDHNGCLCVVEPIIGEASAAEAA